ncbi:MAG: MOP flippase family protein [Anaerolineaceae bacterium]|nr:MOP flippase family protein [Anaerolineaceae bacterium]
MTLAKRTLKGIGWYGSAHIFNKGVDFVSTLVLARLLLPADFGVVGIVVSFATIFQMITELGMSTAIVQSNDIDETDLSTAFWMNLLVSTPLFFLVWLASPWVASFYQAPLLAPLLSLYALTIPLAALASVQRAVLVREIYFRKVSVIESLATIGRGVVSVSLALLGWGVWSLVWGYLTARILMTLALWFSSRWKPSLQISRQSLKKLFGFGFWVLSTRLTYSLGQQVDVLVAGRLLSSSGLGLYTYGLKLANLLPQELNQIVSSVLLPAMSKVQTEMGKIRQAYSQALQALSSVNVPLMAGMALTAPTWVPLVLGDRWLELTPVFQILCVVGLMNGIGGSLSVTVLQALGKVRGTFWLALFQVVVVIPLVYLGSRWGAIGVAACLASFYIIYRLVYQIQINRLIGMSFGQYLQIIQPSFTASLPMIVLVLVVQRLLASTPVPAWLSLGVQVITGVAVYFLSLFLLAREQLAALLRHFEAYPLLQPYAKWLVEVLVTPSR